MVKPDRKPVDMSHHITVKLDKDTAFGAFMFISRYAYHERLEIRDESEKKALFDLCQSIDNELLETFREEYLALVERAKRE